MPQTDILPCPFTHSNFGFDEDEPSLACDAVEHQVRCIVCGASGPFAETDALAILAWNRLSAQAAEIERLRRLVKWGHEYAVEIKNLNPKCQACGEEQLFIAQGIARALATLTTNRSTE